MSDKPAKLTLEQKLLQIIKEDTLVRLLDDDEAIIQLIERGLREALFQKRQEHVGGGWNSSLKEIDSPIVEASRNNADKLAAKIADDLFDCDVVKKTLRDAMIEMLPKAIETALANKLMSFAEQNSQNTVQKIMALRGRDGLPVFA